MTKEEMENLICQLVDHSEYCGWGDSWERAGARDSGLIDRAEAARSKIRATRPEAGE